jgi:hypothetical protein
LRHPIEIHQSLSQEDRNALGQQPVEQFAMGGAEIGQGVVIDGNIAEDPAIGIVAAAQLVELACAADAIDGGVEPEGHEDLGIDRGPSRPVVDGLDGIVQGTEVQAEDIVPDDPRRMIVGDQLVERGGTEDDLLAVGGPQPRATGESRWLGGTVLIGRRLEEKRLFGPIRDAIVWSVHGDSIAENS